MICDMCHKEKPDVESQPSRSQLIFGGFRNLTEDRCKDCEKELCKTISRIIKNIGKKRNGLT